MSTEIKFQSTEKTLVKCNIDPLTCPVRKIRMNPYLTTIQYMCQHPNSPRVEDRELKATGFIYRTCVTEKITGDKLKG